MLRSSGRITAWLLALALALCAEVGRAQPVIQFPGGTGAAPAPGVITQPPAAAGAAINPYTGAAAPFDPYSSSGPAAYQFWSTTPPSNNAGVFAQPGTAPVPGTSPYLPPGTVVPATPGQPQAIFPNGMLNGQQFDYTQAMRLIQDLRLRHTYLDRGSDPSSLGINDSEVAVTFTVPNFLTTGQPLFISPAFGLHLWDGPALPTADLPPSAYSAYIDTQWASDPQLQIGVELGFRIGVYTDFDTFNNHSLRLQGLALGTARLTPNLVAKAGVVYLDRNDIKLLPAGGLLWTPTPQIRFDFFFPQPKLAAYLMTVGRYEVWGYGAAEYGGGAWTIERSAGFTDRIDINDIRVSGGIEWTGPQGFHGFFEGGYVFKRAVVYVVTPGDSFHPDDTFMIRAGVSY